MINKPSPEGSVGFSGLKAKEFHAVPLPTHRLVSAELRCCHLESHLGPFLPGSQGILEKATLQ